MEGMLDFARTPIGRKYLDVTLPNIAKALDAVASQLVTLNAHLAAKNDPVCDAAPALLDALKRFIQSVEGPAWRLERPIVIEAARAAIRKAEGS